MPVVTCSNCRTTYVIDPVSGPRDQCPRCDQLMGLYFPSQEAPWSPTEAKRLQEEATARLGLYRDELAKTASWQQTAVSVLVCDYCDCFYAIPSAAHESACFHCAGPLRRLAGTEARRLATLMLVDQLSPASPSPCKPQLSRPQSLASSRRQKRIRSTPARHHGCLTIAPSQQAQERARTPDSAFSPAPREH